MNKVINLILLLILFPNNLFAYSCDFIPETPQPDWISSDRSIQGHYIGVGVSSKSRKSSDEQINKSKQDAKRDLAENIQVTIKSQFVHQQSATSGKNGVALDEQVDAITQTTSNASIKNIVTDEVWLDRNSCLLWTRIKVKSEVVEKEVYRQQQIVKLQELEFILDTLQPTSVTSTTELNKLSLARSILSGIDFKVINSTNKKKTLTLKIEQMTKIFEGTQSAETIFSDAAKLRSIAKTNSALKKQNISKALQNYRMIMIKFPFSSDDSTWSEKSAYEIASVEIQRDNPCAAKQEIEKIINLSHSATWVLKAKKMRRKAICNPAAKTVFNFRNRFDAKTVSVACSYQINSSNRWNNVCDKVVAYFNSHGAIARKVMELKDSKSDFIINITSTGTIDTRNSSSKKEFQFKGDIMTSIYQQNTLVLQDNYSGIGGWNPISQKMTMDVLGIHVFKRFIKSLNVELQG